MSKKVVLLVPLALLVFSSSASAGWYEIKNYVGTIGTVPVHISLQTYGTINRGGPREWQVDGSYYYDAHRIPIPLQGKREPGGRMLLCEAEPPRSGADSPTVPASSAAHPIPCPITLSIAGDAASGVWNDGKRTLPIELHKVGSLDDTDEDASLLSGVVEIPMWYHTKTYMLLGIYEASEGCHFKVSMFKLRLVNIATGSSDGDIQLDCADGMLMTSIYQNVSRGPNAHQVTLEVGGGKMGSDEVIDIEPRAGH
jgi:hypothetical protein